MISINPAWLQNLTCSISAVTASGGNYLFLPSDFRMQKNKKTQEQQQQQKKNHKKKRAGLSICEAGECGGFLRQRNGTLFAEHFFMWSHKSSTLPFSAPGKPHNQYSPVVSSFVRLGSHWHFWTDQISALPPTGTSTHCKPQRHFLFINFKKKEKSNS